MIQQSASKKTLASGTVEANRFGIDSPQFPSFLGLLPVAVCVCNAPSGVMTYFNDRAAKLWGRSPRLGDPDQRFSGAYRQYWPDGEPLSPEKSPMAKVLRSGTPIQNEEVIIERPDGHRVSVLININPIRDAHSNIVGAINTFHEISIQKAEHELRAYLAAIVDSSDDAIVSKDLDGIIRSWNQGAHRIFGYTAEEIVGKPITVLIPPDRQQEEPKILNHLRRGERVDHFETIRLAKDGRPLDVSLTISPIKAPDGRVIGASKIARDITERRRIERKLGELQRKHSESLEHKVQRATAQLAVSQERLRLAERMASLGTLSAGLGHDMGNVLMPMRAHIEALANSVGPATNGMREHFESIRKSIEYLHTLAAGLRMLAIDPEHMHGSPDGVELESWRHQSTPLLKTTLSRHFGLEFDFEANLPLPAIPAHLLTQAVFNLVQNAAQAMNGPPQQENGMVRINARHVGDTLQIAVADNGPGMTPEVRERCIEPYFTTKTRGISTGMGLALVHGIMQSVGGSLQVQSEPGEGATFTLHIPIITDSGRPEPRAGVKIQDVRLRALMHHLLTSTHIRVVDDSEKADMLATDDVQLAEQFLLGDPNTRALVFGARQSTLPPELSDRISFCSPSAPTAQLRMTLNSLANSMGGVAT